MLPICSVVIRTRNCLAYLSSTLDDVRTQRRDGLELPVVASRHELQNANGRREDSRSAEDRDLWLSLAAARLPRQLLSR